MGMTGTRKLGARSVVRFLKSYDGKPESFREELASHFGVSMRTVERRLVELVAEGVLKATRDGKRLHYEEEEPLPKFKTQTKPDRPRVEKPVTLRDVTIAFNEIAASGGTLDDLEHFFGTCQVNCWPTPQEMSGKTTQELYPDAPLRSPKPKKVEPLERDYEAARRRLNEKAEAAWRKIEAKKLKVAA